MILPVHDILWKAFHEPHPFHHGSTLRLMCRLLWQTQTLPPEDLFVCVRSVDDLLLTTGVQRCAICQAKGSAWLILATDGRWPSRHAEYSERYRRLLLRLKQRGFRHDLMAELLVAMVKERDGGTASALGFQHALEG